MASHMAAIENMDMRKMREDHEFSDLLLVRRQSSFEDSFELKSPAFGNLLEPNFTPPLSRCNSIFYEEEGYKDNPIKLSRYNHNFVELEKIGEGHYGTVYKCRHVIDRV
jgi:hypothetical protein